MAVENPVEVVPYIARYNPRNGEPLLYSLLKVHENLRHKRSYRGIVKPVLTLNERDSLLTVLDWFFEIIKPKE